MQIKFKNDNLLDINNLFIEKKLLLYFSKQFCISNQMLPLSLEKGILTIATNDQKINLSEKIYNHVKFDQLVIKKCDLESIIFYINKFYNICNVSIKETLLKENNLDIGEQIVDKILLDSFQKQASDIHFCPNKNDVEIKYRINGILKKSFDFNKQKWSSVSIRIKVMSEMDISETRIPQDGSFSKEIYGKKIDFRVSCHPTMHGENIVLRVLGNSKSLDLKSLSYSKHIMSDFDDFIDTPDGLIIFTGPVGSGKTTSLYSLLSCLDPHQNNIVTLEDPIEYSIPYIRQTDINKSPNMSFSLGIKSLLRQDPNIMLIGEIRDAETAQMVMRAAMTGHKVFTTLHTNNAIGVFSRLMEFGIEKSLLVQYLRGVVSQRLIRKLCSCKQLVENNLSGNIKKYVTSRFVFKDVGCEKCNNTGFSDRIVIAESLKMKRDVSHDVTLFSNKNIDKYIPEDFKTIAMDGVEKIKNGETTYEELKKFVDIL